MEKSNESDTQEIVKRFDMSIRKLFSLIEKVIIAKKEISLIKSNERKSLSQLTEYMRAYSETDSEELNDFHIELFSILYSENKRTILNDNFKRDKWIHDSNLNLVFGSNWEAPDHNVAFPLSVIYKYTKYIQLEYLERAKNEPEVYNDEWEDSWKMNTANIFMYHLYTIFMTTSEYRTNSTEKETIRMISIYEQLKNILNIDDKKNNNTNSRLGGLLGNLLGDFDLDAFTQNVPKHIDETIDNLPNEMKAYIPEKDKLKAAFNHLNTDKIKDSFSNLSRNAMSELALNTNSDGSINYGKAFGGVVSVFMKPESLAPMSEAFSGMANIMGFDPNNAGGFPGGLPMRALVSIPTIPGIMSSVEIPESSTLQSSPSPSSSSLSTNQEYNQEVELKDNDSDSDDEEIPFI